MGYCRRMGICFREMLAEDGTASPLTAPPPARPSSLSTFRPGIAVIVVLLAVTFSLTFLLLLYAKHCKRRAGGDGGSAADAAFSSSAARRRNSGVSRAVVEALPVFRFGALTGAHKDGLECAVCIARFEPEEVLRLLPKCHHAFHVECVDTWLDAHSTCPLCRSRVNPEDVLLLLPSDDNKGGGDRDPPPVAAAAATRVSGRHSSAGERSSDPLKAASGNRRRSVDSAGGCLEWGRKDAILMGESRGGIERRCGHRIVVSGQGEGLQERWSDLRPSEILFLKSEMIMSGEDRRSVSREFSSSARCASETRGVGRFPGGDRRRAEEERAMRKWLSFEPSRTARWPASRGGEEGPDG